MKPEDRLVFEYEIADAHARHGRQLGLCVHLAQPTDLDPREAKRLAGLYRN